MVNQIIANKHNAFSYIVKQYSKELYWFIRRMVLSHDDAHDILQNMWAKAWSGLSNYRGDASVKSWLYTIARNETYNFIKSSKKNPITCTEDILLQEQASGYFDGEAFMKYLYIAMDTLPDRQKEVFTLKYFQEKKYEEIVEILGGTIGSHKASYHHAVKKIEKYIKSELNLIHH